MNYKYLFICIYLRFNIYIYKFIFIYFIDFFAGCLHTFGQSLVVNFFLEYLSVCGQVLSACTNQNKHRCKKIQRPNRILLCLKCCTGNIL